ncbi:MAG: cupin [Rariglobus sp.]|jgi:predicted cupin superfamily sugar epimerase|nr:cupin [Rariglobus sp.]
MTPVPVTAAEIIASLQLEPLPNEGGFFRRTYTSAAVLADGRPAGTAIYFLITPEGFSALHALVTDEVWHFYAGDPVEHVMLDSAASGRAGHPTGTGTHTRLGTDFARGHQSQLTVPGGVWQAARLVPGGAWALLGCTMSPGWDEREFTLGEREVLLARFPEWAADIRALTR